jgi:hypothetical protein
MKNRHQALSRYAMGASVAPLAVGASALADITYYDGASYQINGGLTIDFADQNIEIGILSNAFSASTAYGFSQGNVTKIMKNWNGYIMNTTYGYGNNTGARAAFMKADDGNMAKTFDFGQAIGPGATTIGLGNGQNTMTYVTFGFGQTNTFTGDDNFQNGDFGPDGVHKYLGLSLDMRDGSGTRHGWIEMSWSFEGDGYGTLMVHGWAFSDVDGEYLEAGAIPAPGVLPLLGLAMGAAGIRRARK